MACGGAQASPVAPSTSTAPTTSEPSPTETPSASPSAAATPAGSQLPTTAGSPRDVDAGIYAMPPWFLIPMSIEIDAGWRAVRDDKARQVNFLRGENAVGRGTLWLAPYAVPSADAEAFLEELRSTPLLTVEAAVPVEVAGLPAQQVDASAMADPAQAGSESRVAGTIDIPAMRLLHSRGITDFAWYTESVEARLRILVIEAGDASLVVYLEAPADEFDAFAALDGPVLSTIRLYPEA